MQNLFFRGLTLGLLLTGLFLFLQNQRENRPALANLQKAGMQVPEVFIATQVDPPLRILSTSIESAEPLTLKLQLITQNQSGNKIRAYALAVETVTNETRNGRAEFINITQHANIWQPTEIRTLEFKDTQNVTPDKIELAIDFVEFSNGTVWGPDLHNSRDILAGQRAGAKLERQRLSKLLTNKGQSAVDNELQVGIPADLSSLAGRDRSSQWLMGFRSGMSAIRGRLKRSMRSRLAIETELGKPFDTSEDKPHGKS